MKDDFKVGDIKKVEAPFEVQAVKSDPTLTPWLHNGFCVLIGCEHNTVVGCGDHAGKCGREPDTPAEGYCRCERSSMGSENGCVGRYGVMQEG